MDHDPFVAGTIRIPNTDEVTPLSLLAACLNHATIIPWSWLMGMNPSSQPLSCSGNYIQYEHILRPCALR